MLSTCRTKLDYCKIKINENKHNSDVNLILFTKQCQTSMSNQIWVFNCPLFSDICERGQ